MNMNAMEATDDAAASTIPQLQERDVALTVIANGLPLPATNHFLQDLVHLHRVFYALENIAEHSEQPATNPVAATNTDTTSPDATLPTPTCTDLSQVQGMTDKIYRLLTQGKTYEIAGTGSVPSAYLRGPGRILDKDGPLALWKLVPEEQAKEAISAMLLEAFKTTVHVNKSPYQNFVQMLRSDREAALPGGLSGAVVSTPNDILLLPCCNKANEATAPPIASMDAMDTDAATGKPTATAASNPYEGQHGNYALFNLAAHHVTTTSTTPDRKVKAVFAILEGLNDATATTAVDYSSDPSQRRPRFLVPLESSLKTSDDDGDDVDDPPGIKLPAALTGEPTSPAQPLKPVFWRVLNPIEAAEFVMSFVFEVWLEKDPPMLTLELEEAPMEPDTTVVVDKPTNYDVLLGRGGLTNTWPGNKRFRDVIALHRPDYIRAIKMDKPAVARKIVRAIRYGNPPGR
jgi:hypothetical protein